MSNVKAAPFNQSAIKTELDKARARQVGYPHGIHSDVGGLGTAAQFREQAAGYDSIAETEAVLTWSGRVKLARAAVALRLMADRLDGKNDRD